MAEGPGRGKLLSPWQLGSREGGRGQARDTPLRGVPSAHSPATPHPPVSTCSWCCGQSASEDWPLLRSDPRIHPSPKAQPWGCHAGTQPAHGDLGDTPGPIHPWALPHQDPACARRPGGHSRSHHGKALASIFLHSQHSVDTYCPALFLPETLVGTCV